MAPLNPRLAVYPGTFDPVTRGHVSLITRGLKIFDQVVFAIAHSTPKKTLFTLEERVEMAKEVFAHEPNIIVEPFDGLLIDYVARRGAGSVLRGLRAVSDFEYEFQMALMNRKLDREIQTVFLMTDFKWMYLSSTIVKEVAQHGGNVKGLVPRQVIERLRERYASLQDEE
ncbi:pantetheine-phosphate adenylyltransferase [Pseudodesulfovibrio senegalensis]|jgi:pantetheine-phosphate adenylyltransferase|uniref:Phosphopantetheine adenylyltransferase n=1 Tax=Pseudodesulfovibrio senegalensis TaxID=1721087 RepID=A0A6N6N2F4_9BACT|nr:pantetheine-phosphate adenylyltransferase [Pseudodesulfovibrio senegalensis]KAB1441186.1 pantetheine-phosphate adenylyltransferase [Pseudodesulfovibrio senegalensis]